MKLVDALFGRGELSYSKVRAITRVATLENEQDLIDIAVHTTAAQLERLTRAYQRSRDLCSDIAGLPGELPRNQRRFVRRSETHGGMIRIEMQLPPEEAALVWNAMQSARDGRPDTPGASAEAPGSADLTQASAEAPATSGEELEAQRANAIVNVARGYLKHRARTLGSGYELVVI